MRERIRQHELYLLELIKNSCTSDIDVLKKSPFINCYAFARQLTYPDYNRNYYFPGMLYRLKYGTGDSMVTQSAQSSNYTDSFIKACIMRDNIALEQECIQVQFDEIDSNDGYKYFAVAKFTLCPVIYKGRTVQFATGNQDWHFICRTADGVWRHKPNFFQPVINVVWNEYGKTFEYLSHSQKLDIDVPAKAVCYENLFFRMC